MENKVCYLCGSTEFEQMDGRVRDSDSLHILRCKNCSLVFLSSFDHINECFYQEDGMFCGKFSCERDVKKWLENSKDDDNRRFNFLKESVKGKKVLDFGCGNAQFLNKSKKLAQRVVGVELQKSMQDYYNSIGIEVHSDIEEVGEKFDLITMFHVLEHINDPITLLKQLGEKLEEGGEIFIEVPNSEDALVTLYKNIWFMAFTYWSCHLFLFNEHTLSEIVKKAGFKINYIKHAQRYGFVNHLWWQIVKKPGGHKKLWFLNWPFLNKWYENSLASMKATDTIVVSISK